MRRRLALAALGALCACAMYGLLHEKLFSQEAWSAAGLDRFAGFTLVYWAAAGLILWLRRAWLVPTVAGFVLFYSTWWCAEFFTWAAPLAVVYFLGSSFFLGRSIAKTVDAITALLIGSTIWIFVITLAVHLPVNTRWSYAAAFALPYVWALATKWRPHELPRTASAHPVLLYVLLTQWLVALSPDVSADGLAMHLAIPAMIARQAHFAFDFHHYAWALMPMGGDFAFTAVYLLGGEMAARLLDFSMLVLIAAMIYQASRRWLSPGKASLAAALFASAPLVQLVTGSLLVENVWAAFVLGASLALFRGELVWAGLLFGAALACKVGTFAFLAPAVVAVSLMWRARPKQFGWRAAAASGALCVAVGAHPYLNAWWRSGNPVYPFQNQIFKAPDFDTSKSFEDRRYRKRVDWNTPFDLTFRSDQYYEGQKGGLGFQYFLLVPAVLLLLNRKAPRAAVALGLTGAALTLVSEPNLRYLYPALPLFSIAIAWLISEIPWLWTGAAVILALNLWFLPDSGWYHANFAIFNRSQFDAYLNFYAPERAVSKAMNRVAPGEPAGFIGIFDVADVNAPAYGDGWHTYRFWQELIHCSDGAQVASVFREFGIHHLITTIPTQTEGPPVEAFVEQWTSPDGISSGPWQIRTVLAQPLPLKLAAAGSYDDFAPNIAYTGAWTYDRQFKLASGATLTYSNHPGDTVRFLFEGETVTYVYTKALNRGTAAILIDGKPRGKLDLYSAATEWQSQTSFSNLGSGIHIIEIRVTGEKNPASSDVFVDLDRFVVGSP